jgi:DNA-binding NarL/FixJ family response regulator
MKMGWDMINIGIIDSHLLLVESLRHLFNVEHNFHCVGTATSIPAGMELLRSTPMDVLLLEPVMPDGDGFQILQQLKRDKRSIITVILTHQPDDHVLLRAINLEAAAFLSKECSLEDLLTDLRRAAAGEMIFPVEHITQLVRHMSSQRNILPERKVFLNDLTPREIEVLQCLVMGKSSDRISKELTITPLTVRTHIRNIITKLGVHSRLEAVSYAINTGCFTPYQ